MPTAPHSLQELQEQLKRLKADREVATRQRDAAEYHLQNLRNLAAEVERQIIDLAAVQGE